jgi:hypothetical protein
MDAYRTVGNEAVGKMVQIENRKSTVAARHWCACTQNFEDTRRSVEFVEERERALTELIDKRSFS